MPFGVVICPRCRRAKGVDLKQKTTNCQCGFTINLSLARIVGRVEHHRDLAPFVARVSAEIAGGSRGFGLGLGRRPKRRADDVHARVVEKARKAGDRAHKIKSAAIELSKEIVVFSFEYLKSVLHSLGIGDAEGALAYLIREGILFEPMAGYYKAVNLTL